MVSNGIVTNYALFNGLSFSVSSIGFGIVLKLSMWQFLKFLLYVIFVDCIGAGVIVATFFWYVSSNKSKKKISLILFKIKLNLFSVSFRY